MLKIKYYGTHTSTYLYIKKVIHNFLQFHNINIYFSEVSEVSVFIEEGIQSVPTLVINDAYKFEFNESDNLYKTIKLLLHKIIEIVGEDSFKKVMVATDFSIRSIAALYFTKSFFKNSFYAIDIINVEKTDGSISLTPSGMSNSFSESYNYLEEMTAEFENEFIGDFSNNNIALQKIFYGKPSEEIIKKSSTYDFIIMGTHGETGLLQRIIGSVSESVATKSKCPVFLIPQNVNFYKPNVMVILNSNAGINLENIETTFPYTSKIINNDIHSENFDNYLDREDVFFLMNRADFIKIFDIVPDSKFKKYYELIQEYRKPLLVWF